MYEIYFYEDEDGNSPIFEYLQALSQRTDKDSRINYNKINDYIQILSQYGITAGEPYVNNPHLKIRVSLRKFYEAYRRRYMGASTCKGTDIFCKLDR